MTKSEQEAKEKHQAFEKQQAKDGIAVHLPRSGEPGSPDYKAPVKAAPAAKKAAKTAAAPAT